MKQNQSLFWKADSAFFALFKRLWKPDLLSLFTHEWSWVQRLFLLLSLKIDADARWRQSGSISDNKSNKNLHSTLLVW